VKAALLTIILGGGLITQALATGPVAGERWKVPLPKTGELQLVWIPAGAFAMGSPETEAGRKVDEGPVTRVTLTQGFWLGRTLVTVGQWKKITGLDQRAQLTRRIQDDTLYELGGKKQPLRDFMHWSRDADPAQYLANEDDDLPVYFVSWKDAQDFCLRLNESERAAGRLPAGYEYNLPTEAQWEYACRAGTTGATYAGPNSAEILARLAWYDQTSANGYSGRRLGATRSGPRAVAQKEPNAWGLYDMYGNIWEWCRDWYGPYPGGAAIDPAGPASGTTRVNRGGSFGSGAGAERSANRAANPPPEASAYRGFRVALAPLPLR
jgi:formylglycine-generating enzyme required for sulfatase activity